MKTRLRLFLIVTTMLLTLTIAIMINVALNFRDYSIKSAVDKSKMTATMVKHGLTSHMVNGVMDKRKYFLNHISSDQNVEFLRILRSKNVIQQYGKGFNEESIIDTIDKEVLKTGNMVQHITETTDKITLRVTIPYKATADNFSQNCLSCHNVRNGDTLGAITMGFDITDMRSNSMMTVFKILGINIIFIIIALMLIGYFVSPYLILFTDMRVGVKKAFDGDFTHDFISNVGGEAKDVINQLNSLFHKMHDTLGNIKHNLSTFIPSENYQITDPLAEAKNTIKELSDIYRFKKTIELDASKDTIFSRIINILQMKYKLDNFSFYEVNHIQNTRKLIYVHGETICREEVDDNSILCRAHRTKTDIISTDFVNLCQACKSTELRYICLPFTINNEHSLILSMYVENNELMKDLHTKIPGIKNYLEAAKPVIESRILMNTLRDASLKDPMTKLYNRRYLEEFIDKTMNQSINNKDTFNVMMLDVDWFKMVNDTYGHDVGDMVIVEIGKLLRDSIGKNDLAIRYGGEEFVIILQNSTDEYTMNIAKKIHSSFANLSFEVSKSETIHKTLSIGIAKYPIDGDSIWKCIKFADTALYVAKTTGRNKIVEYSIEMSENDQLR
jgi:diguanylate cyclase (GGDEF)-like protein